MSQRSSLVPPLALAVVLIVAASSSSLVEGFSLVQVRSTARCHHDTHLHLIPEQGKQLVAAFEAGSVHYRHYDEDKAKQHPGTADERPISAMTKPEGLKRFVSRIFSIPGAIMGRHPAAAPALVDVNMPREEKESDDVVLYPIVGFQFVHGGQRVLPTITNASCPIVSSTLPQQEVYGWYTKACQLDSIYSDTYCEEPKAVMIETTVTEKK